MPQRRCDLCSRPHPPEQLVPMFFAPVGMAGRVVAVCQRCAQTKGRDLKALSPDGYRMASRRLGLSKEDKRRAGMAGALAGRSRTVLSPAPRAAADRVRAVFRGGLPGRHK